MARSSAEFSCISPPRSLFYRAVSNLIPGTPVERAWLDVDLAALRRNARRFEELARVPLLPMVKANGYGLGAREVAGALEELDPWGYGVATIGEGAELRAA